MKTIVNQLNAHPFVAFIFSLLGIGTGFGLQAVGPGAPEIHSYEVIDYIVKICQCIAFIGGGMVGFIAFHGWIVKRRESIKSKSKKK